MMEEPNKGNADNSFLKIETIWSEAEEKYQDITVKEEILSDVEPECILSVQENKTFDSQSDNFKTDDPDQENNATCQASGNFKVINSVQERNENSDVVNSAEVLSKSRIIQKTLKLINKDSDSIERRNSACSHFAKGFKIIKRRLRCGGCRALVCPECCKILKSTLQSHFSGSGKKNFGIYPCELCKLVFYSFCALQAHLRIHMMNAPFVCPDCGLIYNNISFLILHLINKCCHVYKIVRNKCKNCPGIYFTPELLSQHIKAQHYEFTYRCSYCSIVFGKIEDFKNHAESVHENVKVQSLNYFCCSLCADTMIPRFMLDKHTAHHCESSDTYEVEYQCPCGYIYCFSSSFRAHVNNCSKKGILPSKWSFLQKKIKKSELSVIQNKGNISAQVISTSLRGSSLNGDSPSRKYNLKILKKNDCGKARNPQVESGNNAFVRLDEAGNKFSNIKILNTPNDFISKKQDNSCESGNISSSLLKVPKNFTAENSENFHEDTHLNKTHLDINISEKTEHTEKDQFVFKITETPITGTEEEFPKQSLPETVALENENESRSLGENQSALVRNEPEKIDIDRSKIYDHIPCDHLGYVKTQNFESNNVEYQQEEESSSPKINESDVSLEDFCVKTVLDEKTGLITTKKVAAEDLTEEEEDDEDFAEDSYFDEELESTNTTIDGENNGGSDKQKSKGTNSFFICPFCIVLFPKSTSSFQQFRLHVEAYHPNAALNITVDQSAKEDSKNSEKDTSGKNPVGTKQQSQVTDDIDSTDNISSKNQSNKTQKKCTAAKRKSLEDNNPVINNKMDLIVGNKDLVSEIECETEKISYQKSTDKIGKDKDLTYINSVNQNKERKKNTLTEEVKACEMNKGGLEISSDSTNKTNLKLVSSKEEVSKDEKICSKNIEESVLNEYNEISVFVNEIGTESNVRACTEDQKTDECRPDEASSKNEENDSLEKEPENVELNINEESKENKAVNDYMQMALEFDETCETSKDSNWSGISDKVDDIKCLEKEKSKRESEVWSEFYESLMLAEKLKKNKEKKLALQAEREKKSVVSDYSAKRVVKKPKRYRESSDSDYSIGGSENSDSENEVLVLNNTDEDYKGDELGEVEGNSNDDQLHKKQKLFNKLQNVDGKFIDYLFDLINKKEQYLEIYNDHSNLRQIRYGHDLRSYRKKILNGIKHRGRPHKILRYQELIKKKTSPEQTSDSKETVLSKKSETIDSSKAMEKKRGRPRKIAEPSKIKERRRSDKEANFIEKNFKREETETSSPSKRKRKLSSKLQYYKKANLNDEKDDFSSGQVITNKPFDSNKKFSCAVCKEVFQELPEFREHILVHRMEEGTYQCMECGECFVVRPSLEKHLHAFHKIKNTDKYISENQCCNIKKEANDIPSEPLKENQCKVCKDQFDRPMDLTKHFRIHGMAFLKEFKKEGKTKEK